MLACLFDSVLRTNLVAAGLTAQAPPSIQTTSDSLSLAVRNPRRDFANGTKSENKQTVSCRAAIGYLVAEILTKHNIGELSLHSFTNSTSTEAKRSNWELIQKCLRTQGVNLTNDTIDAILMQDQDAVDRLLQNLFLFVTSQEEPREESSPPTPQPPADTMLQNVNGVRSTIAISEQARLEAVSSQYTMGNLQHLLQQQLTLFAPERHQGIIASVMEQRSIFVQKLMEGESPQDAMSAALAQSRNQQHDLEAAQLATQLQQQIAEQQAAVQRPPPQVYQPVHGPEQQVGVRRNKQPATLDNARCRPPNRSPQDLGGSTKQHYAAPFSVPEAKDMSQTASQRLRSMRSNGAETSPRHTFQAWKNDVNNPKTESYRYWDLGSLGPETSEELMAKKIAAQKAREYGIRAGELVKGNCRPRQPPKKEMSKQERAKLFAKTVPLPTRRIDPNNASQKAVPSASPGACTDANTAPVAPPVQRRDSVSSLITRHDANAKSIADIKAEVRRWEEEDQGSHVPLKAPTKRKSPAGRSQKQQSSLPSAAQGIQAAQHTPLQPDTLHQEPTSSTENEADGGSSEQVNAPVLTQSAVEAT